MFRVTTIELVTNKLPDTSNREAEANTKLLLPPPVLTPLPIIKLYADPDMGLLKAPITKE